MKINEHQDSQAILISQVASDSLTIGEQVYRQSVLLGGQQIQVLEPADFYPLLASQILAKLLELSPQILLLGLQNWQQQITQGKLLQQLQQLETQGINFEIMGLKSACWTWNVLTGDQREVAMIAEVAAD